MSLAQIDPSFCIEISFISDCRMSWYTITKEKNTRYSKGSFRLDLSNCCAKEISLKGGVFMII